MPYRIVDHTADLGIDVEAGNLDELFAEAARGFADCITEVGSVGRERRRAVTVEAIGLESLLVDWLSELLFLFETTGELYSEVDATVSETATGWAVSAKLQGESYERERHPLKVPIKAVTYHGLRVGRDRSRWSARVIFDI